MTVDQLYDHNGGLDVSATASCIRLITRAFDIQVVGTASSQHLSSVQPATPISKATWTPVAYGGRGLPYPLCRPCILANSVIYMPFTQLPAALL